MRCAAYFQKELEDKKKHEEKLQLAAEKEKTRREELGMDFNKDDRKMTKADRMSKAQKQKQEGNEMFSAKKYDDAVRRYKKAIDHMNRADFKSNLTSEEKNVADGIITSCELNSAMCYLRGSELAKEQGGRNAELPFLTKAIIACTNGLDLVPSVKGYYRRACCYEKQSEYASALQDLAKAAELDPKDEAVTKKKTHLTALKSREIAKQQKMYAKMF